MSTTHPSVYWFGGDDWQVNATLLDENGNPFNLTEPGTRIQYALMNSFDQRALDETDVTISVVDAAAGQITISVPAAKTSPLPGGKYNDTIRIMFGGYTSTLSYGPVSVTADPWLAPIPAVAELPPRMRLVSK